MLSRSIATLGITSVGILLGVIMASALVPAGPPSIRFHKAWPESASPLPLPDTTARSLRTDRARVQNLWGQSPENVLIYYAPVRVWNWNVPALDPETLGVEIE